MENLMQPVNTRALDIALDALFGQNASQLAGRAYLLVVSAMNEGYEQGKADAQALAKIEAEANIEERLDAAFDNGFMAGKDQAEVSDEDAKGDAWDDGYVAGVDDARRRPNVADGIVQDIINDAAANTLNGEVEVDDGGPYNESNVTDSGDEQPDADGYTIGD